MNRWILYHWSRLAFAAMVAILVVWVFVVANREEQQRAAREAWCDSHPQDMRCAGLWR